MLRLFAQCVRDQTWRNCRKRRKTRNRANDRAESVQPGRRGAILTATMTAMTVIANVFRIGIMAWLSEVSRAAGQGSLGTSATVVK